MSSKAYHRRIWHEMQHLIAVGVYHIGHWQNNRVQVRWFTGQDQCTCPSDPFFFLSKKIPNFALRLIYWSCKTQKRQVLSWQQTSF